MIRERKHDSAECGCVNRRPLVDRSIKILKTVKAQYKSQFDNEDRISKRSGVKFMAQTIFGNEVVESQVVESAESQVTEETPAEEKTTAKRDPLAKYNELTADRQATVDSIVAEVIGKIGGADDIDLPMLLGILDKLNAEKKTAKEADKAKEKERKAAAKEIAEANGEIIKDKVQVGDTIDYFMSTSKVTILQAKVLKVTEKSARIEVTADSLVLFKGKEMKAGDVSGLKLGMKSVAFAKISNLSRNGQAVELAA